MGNQLAFIYSNNTLKAGVYSTIDKSFSRSNEIQLKPEWNDDEKKSQIRSWFQSETLFSQEFDEYSFGLDSFNQTFVPNELFNNSTPKDLFMFNFKSDTEHVDFNRIHELGLVSVFEFPLWLKSMMVISFPHIKLLHKSTIDLKGILNLPTFKERTYVIREDDAISIYRVKQGNLIFFNRFKVSNWEDLIYFTLLTLNNEKASDSNEIIPCNFSNIVEIEKLKEFVTENLGKVTEAINNQDFSLVNQRLCV